MQIVVLGGNGRMLAALAVATVAYGHMGLGPVVRVRGASKRTAVEILAIDEYERLQRMDIKPESPHPGERHREAVNRVNSKRSRAGKAARWQ